MSVVVHANQEQLPLPHVIRKSKPIRPLSTYDLRQPRAQQQLAVRVNSARWMSLFSAASVPHRARILSQSQQGAMQCWRRVPNKFFKITAGTYTCASQRACRLPLTLLNGLTKCSCGAPLDPFGDHLLSCTKLLHLRTPWHNLLQEAVMALSRKAGKQVSHDSKKPSSASNHYSPLYRPDFTNLHAGPAGTHEIVDVTTTAETGSSIVAGAASTPLAAAEAAEAAKHFKYGDVRPHTLLPFAVETGGALGAEAMAYVKRCVRAAGPFPRGDLEQHTTHSCRRSTDFYLQWLSTANCRGQAMFFERAAAAVRAGAPAPGPPGGFDSVGF